MSNKRRNTTAVPGSRPPSEAGGSQGKIKALRAKAAALSSLSPTHLFAAKKALCGFKCFYRAASSSRQRDGPDLLRGWKDFQAEGEFSFLPLRHRVDSSLVKMLNQQNNVDKAECTNFSIPILPTEP